MTCSVEVAARSAITRNIAALALAVCLGASGALAQDDALRSYYTANGLLNRGLYEEALAEYQTYLATDPEGEPAAIARYGTAVSLSQLGRTDAALAVLQALDAPRSFPFTFEAQFLEGQLLHSTGKFEEAGRVFGRLSRRAEDHPRRPEAAGLWIECLHRSGNHREATEQGAAILEGNSPQQPEFGRAVLFTALSLSHLGRDQDGARLLDALDEREDDIGANATLALAAAEVRLGRSTEAAEHYQSLVSHDNPELAAPARLGLARLHRAAARHRESLALLRQLLRDYPQSSSASPARLELAINLIETGEHEDALTQLASLPEEISPDLASRAAYWRAKSALRQGDAAGAADRLEEAIARYPDSAVLPDMLYDLGVARNARSDLEGALKAFTSIVESRADHRLQPAARVAAATTMLRLGRYDDAAELASGVDADAPEAAEAGLVLAEADAMLGRHREATQRLRPWLETHGNLPSADRARYRLALSLAAIGNLRDAERFAGPLLDNGTVDPRFRPGLLAMGDAAFEAGQWERAEHWFSRAATESDEPSPEALLKLGLSLARQERLQPAIDAFARATTADENSDSGLQALFELGQAQLLLGNDQPAAAAFEQLLQRAPDARFAGHALRHLGGIAERKGDAVAAAELYSNAADADGSIATEVLRDRARALLAAERYDAVRAFPADDPVVRAYGAIARARMGEHQAAAEALREIGESDALPRNLRRAVRFERAWCLRQLGEEDDALQILGAIVTDEPADRFTAFAALEAASIQLDAARPDEAERWLSAASTLAGSQPAIVEPAMAAQLEFRLAQRDAANEAHADVIERLTGFDEAHAQSVLRPAASLLLGDSLLAEGHPRRAVQAYQQAVETAPPQLLAPALLRLGDALGRAESWPESREAFDRYLSDFPDEPFAFEARFGIGWALEHEGEFERARAAYQRVVDTHDGPTAARAQFQIGECLFAEERYDEAVRELLRVDILYDYPEWSAAALYEAGRAFEQLRKFGEARQQYRETVERFPESDWAALARDRLTALSASGQR